MKKIRLTLLLFFLLIFTNSIYAYNGITFYGAEISANDRYNSNGVRLTSVRDILRQDRANIQLSHVKDKYDDYNSYFASKQNREMFGTATITISPELAQKIVNSNEPVLITVFVLTPYDIDVQAGLPTPGVD